MRAPRQGDTRTSAQDFGEDAAVLGIAGDTATRVMNVLRSEQRAESFGVWPQNATAVQAFLASSTQWRTVAGLGGVTVTGLDYASAQVAIDGHGLTLTPDDWRAFRAIEQAAAAALNGVSE